MEGLRQISQNTFDGTQKFNKIADDQAFDTLALVGSKAQRPLVYRSAQPETAVSTWLASAESDTGATLKLVRLTSESNTSLNVSGDIFSSMMRSLKADPGVLYLICNVKDGFHSFPGDTKTGHFLPTWYVGTSRYAVLWTFDEAKSLTAGVVIERQQNAFTGLTGVLEKFVECVSAPHVMCFAIPLYQLHFYDARTESALGDMRRVEKSVGFGPRRGPDHFQAGKESHLEQGKRTTTFTIDEIMALSQKVHEVAGKIRNNDRLRQGSVRMLEEILTASREAQSDRGGDGDHWHEGYKKALRKLSEAVPVLRGQMEANKAYLEYMQYRAENLAQVVSEPPPGKRVDSSLGRQADGRFQDHRSPHA